MTFPDDEIAELKTLFGSIQRCDEGSRPYLLFAKLILPSGCTPTECVALLCPVARDGYPSRLFFDQKIASPTGRNWTEAMRILDRTWQVFSWKVNGSNLRLAQIVAGHLKALQ